jgi:6-phosphogluconate dehydrogenase
MQLGIIGLGRMGANIGRRLMKAGHKIVGFDASPEAVKALQGAAPAADLDALVAALAPPRAIWVMLPAGRITEETIAHLGLLLSPGDTVIDGGNTFYKDDIRRGKALASKNIHYVDCGTSGGVWGLERGYCMMIGGNSKAVERLDPIFAALAPGTGTVEKTKDRKGRDPRVEKGYMHCGPVGSGHFVKMVHNGIEYGLMQAYAEGFDVLRGKNSPDLPEDQRFNLDLPDIAEVWRRGSVISSWLLDLTAEALAQSPTLENFGNKVADSGEGRWTIDAALEEAVAVPVLAASLFARFSSRVEKNFGNQLLSAMRHAFGGHKEGEIKPMSKESTP